MRGNRPESPGLGFSTAVGALRPLVKSLTSRTYRGTENVPREGGAILVFNHISHLDPLVTGLFVYEQGHLPRYLVKEDLFRTKVLGDLLEQAEQIPVARLTSDAVNAYQAAVDAIADGKLVGVYPEGTLTRDPDLWPMRGKSGAARIALATGAPVIPVAHWGVQDLLAPYAKKPDIWPRKHVEVLAGTPVPLDDLRGREVTTEVVNEATERIMASLVSLVEELRGEQAPVERFDPRRAGVAQIGNPHQTTKDGSA